MSLITPADYKAALTAEGVLFVTHDGWQTVDRPGPWDPHGVMVHHTGPYSTVTGMITMLINGRSDLPGPLAHVGITPAGVVHLTGWFDVNGAGMGDYDVYLAVLNERPLPLPLPTSDTVDGNAAFYNAELIHPGDGSPYPEAQLEAWVRWAAAICRVHGWTANSAIRHRDWTRRKVDIAYPLADLRQRVADRLAHSPGWTPGDPEDDMAFTETQMIDFVRRGVQAELGDENVGALSDRIVDKVIERALPQIPKPPTAAEVALAVVAVLPQGAVILNPEAVAEAVVARLFPMQIVKG